MDCANAKGWITDDEKDKIFNFFGGYAGEDDLDVEEAKLGFEKVHQVTDFDFGGLAGSA